MNISNAQEAIFGGGCFWCTEAIFSELQGVTSVESGYSGGDVKNPTYKEICTGQTGHAEVIKIKYDPEQLSFTKLLEVFLLTHDPTTLNRQGADVGTQYRSVIFYLNEKQKQVSEEVIALLNQEKVYPTPIVTEITEFTNYYPAENYHQDYFKNNKTQAYCSFVIQPKMDKFRKAFSEHIKK